MVIYGVVTGNQYEGGGARDQLYKIEEDAIKCADQLALQYNADGDEYVKDDKGVWRNGYDYIWVMKYELI